MRGAAAGTSVPPGQEHSVSTGSGPPELLHGRRVSGSNPGGSGVEFWHQADFLIIWNSIRAPPSSWVTRTASVLGRGVSHPGEALIQIMTTLHLPGPGIEPQTGALTLCIFTT